MRGGKGSGALQRFPGAQEAAQASPSREPSRVPASRQERRSRSWPPAKPGGAVQRQSRPAARAKAFRPSAGPSGATGRDLPAGHA